MKATRRDPYNDQFVVVRFDDPKKRKTKEFRPFHLSASRWLVGDPPGKLPLFNLAELRNRPTEKVYLVEGEKCACTLRDELGLLAAASAHGAKAADKTDWTPLADRKVVILPDADDEGERYASKAANALLNLEQPARIRIVRLPDLPPKADCVEWLQSRNGQPREDTIAQLEALIAAAPEEKELPGPESKQTECGGIENLDAYLENDGGNAEMFVDRYSEIVRYSHAHESWFIWDGNRWLSDALENVHQLALELSKTLAAELLNTPGRPDAQKLKRAIAMGSQNKISAALWLARSDPRI
jgi:putative DNA primase/helicase